MLLEYRANAIQEAADRTTPLHFAAAAGAEATVIALLQARGDPQVMCDLGRSPLDDAIAGEHWKVVKLLMWMAVRVLS